MFLLLAFLLSRIVFGISSSENGCPAPTKLGFVVERVISRPQRAFTEGLVFRDGALYESTGLYGSSRIQRIDPVTGSSAEIFSLPRSVFGEGVAEMNGEWLVLSWKERAAFRWTAAPATTKEPYAREGWGLTSDGESWIASDGSENIYFLDRKSLATRKTLRVRGGSSPLRLNELEWSEGQVFANNFKTDEVLRISADSGCVSGKLDVSALRREAGPEDAESVANGIAIDPRSGEIYLTGKNWSKIYVGHIY